MQYFGLLILLKGFIKKSIMGMLAMGRYLLDSSR